MHRRVWMLLLIVLGMALPHLARAQDPSRFRGLPSLVCADRRTSPLCQTQRRSSGSKGEELQAALSDSPYMPMIACEVPGTLGPCSTKICGDKICAFDESSTCALDCPLPVKADICRCDKTVCNAYHVECDAAGCVSTSVRPTAEVCKCEGAGGSQTCQGEEDKMCQMMRFEQPTQGCELVRFKTGSRRAFAHCSTASCPSVYFGLNLEQDELPNIQRTDVEGPK